VQIVSFSPVQVDNLALMGQVWGFLKYHHPAVRTGQRPWDLELLRELPAVLAAPDRAVAAAVLVRWIDALGAVPPCQPCVTDAATPTVHFRPALDWLSDSARLTPALSQRLLHIYRNRAASGKQFYVSLAPYVNNPVFSNELAHAGVPLVDRGYRLLAVFRFWNDIEYWFPYRDIIGEDWHAVLRDVIPHVVLADSDLAYQQAMMALVARVNDTHAVLRSSVGQRPPVGECHIPIKARFIEGRAIVSQADDAQGPLRRGDELLAIDGQTVAQLLRERAPYYSASNEPTRLREIASDLNRGTCTTPAEVRVARADGCEMLLQAPRIPNLRSYRERTHDRPGDTFQLLSKEVAYLKLSNFKAADVPSYLRAAAGTRGLVVDIRNYPSESVVFPLGGLLVRQPTPFVRFTHADLDNPGQFVRNAEPYMVKLLQGQEQEQPNYTGKLVILVDEVTQSAAEFTAMALRAVPGARVVGSTSAGADGNASAIVLPSGLSTNITGIGIFYPDLRATQRVGIFADVHASPTVHGFRAGRDEVLEAGLREILGDSADTAEIQRLARP
jgi:C-terminal processing protease CtpA/Prc